MKIYDEMTGISENFADEALEFDAKDYKKRIKKNYCCGLVASLSLIIMIGATPWFDGASSRNGSGSGYAKEIHTFMSYSGPVFPLTMQTPNLNISAIREIKYDFYPYLLKKEIQLHKDGTENIISRSKREAIITDAYLLENKGDQ